MCGRADNVSPCVTANHPCEALHQMQHLLSIVEDHGTQLGKEKCKLLISGRPNTIRKVQSLLKDEPELLTFHGTLVQTVEDQYVHIGVPQAPLRQSHVMADYGIEKDKIFHANFKGQLRRLSWGSAHYQTERCSFLTTSLASCMEQTLCI